MSALQVHPYMNSELSRVMLSERSGSTSQMGAEDVSFGVLTWVQPEPDDPTMPRVVCHIHF